eukprot:m.443651 g.443651  ORF g.443651 m.443651 type:complete len:486 (-) comp18987_c0_seq1:141-1598(-)
MITNVFRGETFGLLVGLSLSILGGVYGSEVNCSGVPQNECLYNTAYGLCGWINGTGGSLGCVKCSDISDQTTCSLGTCCAWVPNSGCTSKDCSPPPTSKPTASPTTGLPRCCLGDDSPRAFRTPFGGCGAYVPGSVNFDFCGADVHHDSDSYAGCVDRQENDPPPNGCSDPNTGLFACQVCPTCAGFSESIPRVCEPVGGSSGCVKADNITLPTNCLRPTLPPTGLPTLHPTSASPSTRTPSAAPTTAPTQFPTQSPTTTTPTTSPVSNAPTHVPTSQPSLTPILRPSRTPTTLQTASPSSVPTVMPTSLTPTSNPTMFPTRVPTESPSHSPSSSSFPPTKILTLMPTLAPTPISANDVSAEALAWVKDSSNIGFVLGWVVLLVLIVGASVLMIRRRRGVNQHPSKTPVSHGFTIGSPTLVDEAKETGAVQGPADSNHDSAEWDPTADGGPDSANQTPRTVNSRGFTKVMNSNGTNEESVTDDVQ